MKKANIFRLGSRVGIGIGTSIALGGVLFSAAPALAADCTTSHEGLIYNGDLQSVAAAPSAISGAIGNINSIFLGQSAFVASQGSNQPDQPGGGVWVRALGGEATTKSTSTSDGIQNPNSPTTPTTTAHTTCNNVQHQSYAGAQIGMDVARLNLDGWNVHLGGMAGYVGSKINDNFGFTNSVQVPFFGTYLMVSKGRFLADLTVRRDSYNFNFDNPAYGVFNQPVGAQGIAVSANASYNFDVGNGWFIEPSAGFVYSNTSVDRYISPGTIRSFQGTVDTNSIESALGRLSLRVGTSVESQTVIWQPFVTASVVHEFAGDIVLRYATLPYTGGYMVGDFGTTYNQTTTTSRVGTYGQYSVGLAAQFAGTGLTGYVRGDYRNGENIEGWAANGGLRYSFAPETVALVTPVKAVQASSQPTNWTGLYVGGFAGAAFGRDDIGYVGDNVNASSPWLAGGIGGIELGYNYQFANNWVVGIEADIGAGNIHGGRPAGMDDAINSGGVPRHVFSSALYTATPKSDWTGTVAGRVGYTWNRTLLYAKGGVAFTDDSTSEKCIFGADGYVGTLGYLNIPCTSPASQSYMASFRTPHSVRVGYTAGLGAEFDLGRNWSMKSEYDVLSFGRHNSSTDDGDTIITDKLWINQVKVGLNYKLGGQ